MKHSERLFTIFFRLIRGERLATKTLAEEFGVSQRALQHDLNDRLPEELHRNLIIEGGVYYLDPLTITSFFPEHIQKILSLVDASGILPHKFDRQTIQNLLSKDKEELPFTVLASRRAELTDSQKRNYSLLEKAISQKSLIKFIYKKNSQQPKEYSDVEPYKLIDHQGVWYLAAVHASKIKTFSVLSIETIYFEKGHFIINQKYLDLMVNDQSIWLGTEKFQVELLIREQFADYFTRRNVIANQKHQVNPDKTVTVKIDVTHEKEILPIIRYWLPAIDDIKPSEIKTQLLDELKLYMSELEKKP